MPFSERPRLWVPEAPAILRRRYREVELTGAPIGLEGYFGWELVHAATGDVVDSSKGLHHNLIVNNGLDLLFSNGMYSCMNYCRVGTGSTTPANNQTDLVSQIGATASAGGFDQPNGVGPGNAYFFQRNVRVFTEAEANGNLTEVGFGVGDSGINTLFMRQLFLDGSGVPTTIIKTSAFQLRVVYELRIYIPQTDVVQTMTVNGVSRSVLCRVGSLYSWTQDRGLGYQGYMTLYAAGTFGAAGILPVGPQIATYMVVNGYTPGSYSASGTATFDASVGNDQAWSYLVATMGTNTFDRELKWDLTSGGGAAITKTDVDKFVIAHSRTWARYIP